MSESNLTSVDGMALRAVVQSPFRVASRGLVAQAHGIGADLDEGGMFRRLAERLADCGGTVLRFSFRGHGGSGGTQRGVTVAGEMLDLQAAVEYLTGRFHGSLSIVASSFGAVPTALLLPALAGRVERLVLWNPVLNLRRTYPRRFPGPAATAGRP